MGRDKTGKTYESLTAHIFGLLKNDDQFVKVEKDVKLPCPEGVRQIDVLITTKNGITELKTIVECRDYSKPLSRKHVDGVHSVWRDVGANQAVIVARNGFSGGAKRKAQRLGISLFTLAEATEKDWAFAQQMAIRVREIIPTDMSVKYSVFNNAGEAKIDPRIICDRYVWEIIGDLMKNQEGDLGEQITLTKSDLPDDLYVRTDGGQKLPLSDIEVRIEFTTKTYFGFIDEAPFLLLDEEKPAGRTVHIFVESTKVGDFYKGFTVYPKPEDCPIDPNFDLVSYPPLSATGLKYGRFASDDAYNAWEGN